MVYIVGKMAQNEGWCESVVVLFPSSLGGLGWFHPYMCLFSVKTFCDLFLLLFLYCCLGMVKEKRGGREAEGKMHGL